MADDGHVILDAQGRRILRDDGSLDICQACCGGEPCAYCTGSTPKTITVVLSDIDKCNCHYGTSWGGSENVDPAPDIGPNGTFVLQQDELYPCQYSYVATCSSGQLKQWATGNRDCSGEEEYAFDIIEYHVTARFFNLTTLVIYTHYHISGTSDKDAFESSATISSGSCSGGSCSNTQTICRNSDITYHWINGSATATPS